MQGSRFLLAFALGAVCGLHYDFLRGLRRSLRWLTPLLDLWFVLCWLVGNLLFALRLGGGQFRIYMLVGSLLGSAAYFAVLSRLFLPCFTKFWAVFSWPLRKLGTLGKIFLQFLKKIMKNIFSSEKKSVTIKRQNAMNTRTAASGGTYDAPAQIVTHYKAVDLGPDGLRLRHDHDITAADQRAGRGTRPKSRRGRGRRASHSRA